MGRNIIQFLRNSTILSSLDTAKDSIAGLVTSDSVKDGNLILARYGLSSNPKTVAGVVTKIDGVNSISYIYDETEIINLIKNKLTIDNSVKVCTETDSGETKTYEFKDVSTEKHLLKVLGDSNTKLYTDDSVADNNRLVTQDSIKNYYDNNHEGLVGVTNAVIYGSGLKGKYDKPTNTIVVNTYEGIGDTSKFVARFKDVKFPTIEGGITIANVVGNDVKIRPSIQQTDLAIGNTTASNIQLSNISVQNTVNNITYINGANESVSVHATIQNIRTELNNAQVLHPTTNGGISIGRNFNGENEVSIQIPTSNKIINNKSGALATNLSMDIYQGQIRLKNGTNVIQSVQIPDEYYADDYVQGLSLNDTTNKLTFTLHNGTSFDVDMSSLRNIYTVPEGDNILIVGNTLKHKENVSPEYAQSDSSVSENIITIYAPKLTLDNCGHVTDVDEKTLTYGDGGYTKINGNELTSNKLTFIAGEHITPTIDGNNIKISHASLSTNNYIQSGIQEIQYANKKFQFDTHTIVTDNCGHAIQDITIKNTVNCDIDSAIINIGPNLVADSSNEHWTSDFVKYVESRSGNVYTIQPKLKITNKANIGKSIFNVYLYNNLPENSEYIAIFKTTSNPDIVTESFKTPSSSEMLLDVKGYYFSNWDDKLDCGTTYKYVYTIKDNGTLDNTVYNLSSHILVYGEVRTTDDGLILHHDLRDYLGEKQTTVKSSAPINVDTDNDNKKYSISLSYDDDTFEVVNNIQDELNGGGHSSGTGSGSLVTDVVPTRTSYRLKTKNNIFDAGTY